MRPNHSYAVVLASFLLAEKEKVGISSDYADFAGYGGTLLITDTLLSQKIFWKLFKGFKGQDK